MAGFKGSGVCVAARRVRVFLPELIPSDAEVVDAALAELLNGEWGPDAEAGLRAVLEADPVTAMFLDAVLDDAPHFRPPQVADQQLKAASFQPLPGDQPPPLVEMWCCPEGDFEWFRREVGQQVPLCSTAGHGRLERC